jgi:anti-sigma factor RsiW
MAEDIRTCRDAEEHLAPYVDGEETLAVRVSVESHLAACPPCRELAAAGRSARDLVVEHRADLRTAAPAELRARCAALQSSAFAKASARQARTSSSVIRKWAPLSLAASLLLAVAAVFVFGLNDRVEALAASLAVDHVKCFKLAGTDTRVDAPAAESRWQQDHGWPIVVPQTAPSEELKLVDVRRCFSTDGRAAHMMYTWRGAPLSLYVLQENAGADRVVEKMGHEAVIWCANKRTYAVIADGHPQDLTRIVDYMKAHAR